MTANSTCTDARNSTDAPTWMSRNTDVVLSQAGRCDAVVARPVFSLTVRPTSAGLSNVAPVFTLTELALATGGGILIVVPAGAHPGLNQDRPA